MVPVTSEQFFGAFASWVYGVVADAALPLGGVAGTAMILWRNRRLGRIRHPVATTA
jgi:hypothetical protein